MIDVNTVLSDLVHHEGCISHMYQDTEGNVTVGIGELVPNVEGATAMRFELVDAKLSRQASPSEVTSDFVRVQSMDKGHIASYYEAPTAPRVAMTWFTCSERIIHRLDVEFFPGIVKLLPNFATFPESAQRAISDMAFNLGVGGLGKFGVFLTDCNRGDFRGAAFESHRKTCSSARNDWTKQMLLQAAGGDTT